MLRAYMNYETKNKTTSFTIRHTNINIAITREKNPLFIIMWFGQDGSLHYLKGNIKTYAEYHFCIRLDLSEQMKQFNIYLLIYILRVSVVYQ